MARMADLGDVSYRHIAMLRAAGRLLMLAAFDERPDHGNDIPRRLTDTAGDAGCCANARAE